MRPISTNVGTPVNTSIEAPLSKTESMNKEIATAVDAFEGTKALTAAPKKTALEKHLGFFDMNGDGSVSVSEVVDGVHQLGLSGPKVYLLAPVLNLVFGTMTRGYPSFSIDLSNIKAGKHEGSSDVFDQSGKFDPVKFEELFKKFDTNNDGMLDGTEIENFVARNAKTTFGRLAVKMELPLLMRIAGEDREVNGETTKVLTKERLSEFYDGSLFYKLAGRAMPKE